MLKKIILISLFIVFAMSLTSINASAQKKRSASHSSGHYKSGKGSSHKGGKYKNTSTGNHYRKRH